MSLPMFENLPTTNGPSSDITTFNPLWVVRSLFDPRPTPSDRSAGPSVRWNTDYTLRQGDTGSWEATRGSSTLRRFTGPTADLESAVQEHVLPGAEDAAHQTEDASTLPTRIADAFNKHVGECRDLEDCQQLADAIVEMMRDEQEERRLKADSREAVYPERITVLTSAEVGDDVV